MAAGAPKDSWVAMALIRMARDLRGRECRHLGGVKVERPCRRRARTTRESAKRSRAASVISVVAGTHRTTSASTAISPGNRARTLGQCGFVGDNSRSLVNEALAAQRREDGTDNRHDDRDGKDDHQAVVEGSTDEIGKECLAGQVQPTGGRDAEHDFARRAGS